MTTLQKQDEAREGFLSICESLGVRREESWIIVHLSIYGRSSVKEINTAVSNVSSRWINELLQQMVSRRAITRDGNDGRRVLYNLNLENPSIDRLTAGFRTRDRKTRSSTKIRRSEEEWKRLVLNEIDELDSSSVRRAELANALSRTGISDSRLSQIIGKLIDERIIQRLRGRGFACYKRIKATDYRNYESFSERGD